MKYKYLNFYMTASGCEYEDSFRLTFQCIITNSKVIDFITPCFLYRYRINRDESKDIIHDLLVKILSRYKKCFNFTLFHITDIMGVADRITNDIKSTDNLMRGLIVFEQIFRKSKWNGKTNI